MLYTTVIKYTLAPLSLSWHAATQIMRLSFILAFPSIYLS